jgi:O-antigen biosynthesis protein WbqP
MYPKIKRLLDIITSAIALIVLSPLLLSLAAAVKLDSPGAVLFKQKRVGRGKTHFLILKYRTMRGDTPGDVPTHLLQDPDKYITPLGKLLRKTSLDELPQLLNILAGDMSVVGPRPALWNQLDLIELREPLANILRPGLTGWAQIHGRDELPLAVKAKYDREYAERAGFIMDARIFALTFVKVFKRDGIKEGGAE